MKLRITGIATVLALALCLALLTTGASAQSVQKSVAHRVVTNLGGGPLPQAPAPAPRVVPMAPAPVAPAPRVAPRVAPAVTHATHAIPSFGIGIATSHALAGGGFLGNGLDNGCGSDCGNNGLSGTSASGTAIGLGI